MNWLVNLAIYNVVWLICVLGGNSLAWLGLVLVAGHFLISPNRRRDALLATAVLTVGVMTDGILHTIGFFTFIPDQFPIPFWLAVIWLALATLPNHSLSWMKRRPVLSALFGALGGPLAYWGGARLGAATLNWPLLESLLLLAVVWGLLWPLIMLLSSLNDKKKIRVFPAA
ncbi:DUF2878 domain-containing protein [Desulfofustis glycolicus]|uniref:DUF2878 domain-containing protein n=1 Tax=Desulfofustis glycolicus DSM 9705 TaxID=1121409 RepID=A0A1M5RYF3_9BACT|nr:DUF2878 domain-containing protein [Desulfofustis glycolicus]MCB2216322.1 DUF2878 domain-containing protein [Desulfobulbaceae bacterium]SHH31229.1 Protein of unknown function [Desulfofustis glycolicus DSM 9705]